LTIRRSVAGVLVWLACQTALPIFANQDPLAAVRELYLAADYEGALATIDGLDADTRKRTEVADYRVLSLLALDRTEEARAAITSIVESDPFHHLSETQASPRLRSVFEETRKAMLPDLVQRWYADAKAAYDHHDPAAGRQFDRLIALLDDPDLKNAAVSDLRAVALGFRDLVRLKPDATAEEVRLKPDTPAEEVRLKPDTTTEKAAPKPDTTTEKAAPKPDTTAVALPLTGPPDTIRVTSRGASPVFTPKAPPPPGLEPPLPIAQPFPEWSPRRNAAQQTYRGILEVTIDEQGNVTTVALQQAMQPAFDQALLKAARKWKYKPALLNGTPVPFVKVIEIQIQSEP
jgi:TonB family protein